MSVPSWIAARAMPSHRQIYICLGILILIFWIPLKRSPHSELDGVEAYRPTARLAVVCCGNRSDEALVLIKSAFLFSQDANLDIFVIADKICGPALTAGVQYLQFQARHWKSRFNVTCLPYEVPAGTEHWFVPDQWACSTNRLFLHKILPESIDAVLYLDMDHVILSNLTEVWEYFVEDQRQSPYAVVSLANHVPPPAKCAYIYRDIPFAGNGGINSGTIFMNLTRLREFRFERLVYEMYEKYKGRLYGGPDQDILNIIFGTYKDNATIMDCNYAFHPAHCGDRNGREHNCKWHTAGEGPLCFCWPSLINGVKLIHGYGQTLEGLYGGQDFQENFMQSLWNGFAEVPLDSGALLEKIQVLKGDFTKLPKQPPCFALTPEILYRDAEEYLLKIILKEK